MFLTLPLGTRTFAAKNTELLFLTHENALGKTNARMNESPFVAFELIKDTDHVHFHSLSSLKPFVSDNKTHHLFFFLSFL